MNTGRIVGAGLAVVAMLMLGGLASAASSPSYDIDWQTIGSGGATASGGSVVLDSTLGQTAIGVAGSGVYQVAAGYSADVSASVAGTETVFLPIVVKD